MNGSHGLGFPTGEYDNRGWHLYVTSLVMIILSGVFVVGRTLTRYWYMVRLSWDDAAVAISLLSSMVVSICMQLAVENGYGMRKDDLTTSEVRTALKLFFIAQAPYKLTVGLNKISACLLYLRIFVNQGFRIACFVVIAVIAAWTIGAIGATIFQCVPLAASWDKSVKGSCIDKSKFWIAYAVLNIFTDIIVLVLPLPSVFGLQLNRRDKTLVCATFLIGGVVTVTSILRTTSVSDSVQNQSDITYNFITRGIWTVIEANLGIITACLPVLRRPLIRAFPKLLGSTKAESSRGTGGGSAGPSNLSKLALSYPQAFHKGDLVNLGRLTPKSGGVEDEQWITLGSTAGSDVGDLEVTGGRAIT